MNDLIKAFTIFSKYTDSRFPIVCDEGIMRVVVDPSIVSDADAEELSRLDFFPDTTSAFMSWRFGSN